MVFKQSREVCQVKVKHITFQTEAEQSVWIYDSIHWTLLNTSAFKQATDNEHCFIAKKPLVAT